MTVRTLAGPVHSGMYGGAAPDALAALISMLATLRDAEGRTTITGLDAGGTWSGADYPVERFRSDAGVLDGVAVLGGSAVADALWARPAVNVLALDAPSVDGVTAAIQHTARALVNLRVPPGIDAAEAQALLVEHLERVAPWGVRVEVERRTVGEPFAARTDGPGFRNLCRRHGAGFRQASDDGGAGRSHPAVQHPAGRAPGRRDPPHRRRGAWPAASTPPTRASIRASWSAPPPGSRCSCNDTGPDL